MEDQISYFSHDENHTDGKRAKHAHLDDSIQQYELAAPINEALESGSWTQSIIWGPRAPFRDFTQIVEPEEEVVPEEKASGKSHIPSIGSRLKGGVGQDVVRCQFEFLRR